MGAQWSKALGEFQVVALSMQVRLSLLLLLTRLLEQTQRSRCAVTCLLFRPGPLLRSHAFHVARSCGAPESISGYLLASPARAAPLCC